MAKGGRTGAEFDGMLGRRDPIMRSVEGTLMSVGLLLPADVPGTRNVRLARLMALCARDRQNALLWAEFLRRVTPKIRCFIRGTLQQSLGGYMSEGHPMTTPGGTQEKDLFQSTIVRLVENDCAVMRRFSGNTDEEVIAYLAVVTRSVVRDCLRKELAQRRPTSCALAEAPTAANGGAAALRREPQAERAVLLREIRELCERTLHPPEAALPSRDRLIFELRFREGLSARQIARCEGVRLTKTGVEKVLARLTERLRRAVTLRASAGGGE